MPPSQLKQLKASLRETGVLGPQKSKSQRKAQSKDSSKRIERNAALATIRERFNPFEVKTSARKEKFDVVSGRKPRGAGTVERPGVTRGLGEERRRETLLKEMQNRNKVGGMVDRRFGENDPSMTPEQRAAERFAKQNERNRKREVVFNLENDSGEEEEMLLTHGGRTLGFDDGGKDDFDGEGLSVSEGGDDQVDGDEFENQDGPPRKRLRIGDEISENGADDEETPQRRKTKKEVMQEVIAKSKMYKAERQAVKEDDDKLRVELDKGMSEFYDALRSQKPPEKRLPTPPSTDSEPHMDPGRAAMLAGKSRKDAEKEYEQNLRVLKMEARSKPSVRTKTEEEKAAEEAARLEELERERVRRMKGEADDSDEEENSPKPEADDVDVDDAEAFGLAQNQSTSRSGPEFAVEDEDEFVLDDDLIASGSDIGSDLEVSDSEPESLSDDGDDDFINGLVLPPKANLETSSSSTKKPASSADLAFTFPCPQTHGELLSITESSTTQDLPTVIQRIRALYHKGLEQGNAVKLENFASVLTEHLIYLTNETDCGFDVLESLIRHLHSMAKSQADSVAAAFRNRLQEISEQRPLDLTSGDLMILTAISSIFPTSDLFHPVSTPAMLTIGRYLGQSSIQSLGDLVIGAYCCSLALQYQAYARRYIPEVTNYVAAALAILAPSAVPITMQDSGHFDVSVRLPLEPLRTTSIPKGSKFDTFSFQHVRSQQDLEAAGIMGIFARLAENAARLWEDKSAVNELLEPIVSVLDHIGHHDLLKQNGKSALVHTVSDVLTNLQAIQTNSIQNRKPLFLHNHRPLAIKSSYPAFVENYNPDRHYDPDRDRAELAKLKAEHKRERKGAMRELRKDANFVARESLREKKEKDAAYEKKFKRLVAEIQGEEGREKKEYEREVKKRKASKK